jgi:hypothetical protein
VADRYGSREERRIGRLSVIGAPPAEFVTAAMDASFEAEEDDQGDAYFRMEQAITELRRSPLGTRQVTSPAGSGA